MNSQQFLLVTNKLRVHPVAMPRGKPTNHSLIFVMQKIALWKSTVYNYPIFGLTWHGVEPMTWCSIHCTTAPVLIERNRHQVTNVFIHYVKNNIFLITTYCSIISAIKDNLDKKTKQQQTNITNNEILIVYLKCFVKQGSMSTWMNKKL